MAGRKVFSTVAMTRPSADDTGDDSAGTVPAAAADLLAPAGHAPADVDEPHAAGTPSRRSSGARAGAAAEPSAAQRPATTPAVVIAGQRRQVEMAARRYASALARVDERVGELAEVLAFARDVGLSPAQLRDALTASGVDPATLPRSVTDHLRR